MAFDRPTLAELIDRAETDIETRLPGADARLRRANLNVLARAHSGAVHAIYGYLAFIARQILPDTAEAEFMERWASIWGISRNAATFATGTATATGTDPASIPAATELQTADGVAYTTDGVVVIAAGTATLALTAVEAGDAGNVATGVQLSFVSPIADVDTAATVIAPGLAGGGDSETDAALRARLLVRLREPPQGGAAFDYVAWAIEAPGIGDGGVTRAWATSELGAGAVTVRFVQDDHPSDILPAAGVVTTVGDYIETKRPMTADVTVLAPIAATLDFTIALTPDTTAVRAAVEAELVDLIEREAAPGAAILLSQIREAVSIAAGETNNNVTVPAADVAHLAGEIAVMGTVTWA